MTVYMREILDMEPYSNEPVATAEQLARFRVIWKLTQLLNEVESTAVKQKGALGSMEVGSNSNRELEFDLALSKAESTLLNKLLLGLESD